MINELVPGQKIETEIEIIMKEGSTEKKYLIGNSD